MQLKLVVVLITTIALVKGGAYFCETIVHNGLQQALIYNGMHAWHGCQVTPAPRVEPGASQTYRFEGCGTGADYEIYFLVEGFGINIKLKCRDPSTFFQTNEVSASAPGCTYDYFGKSGNGGWTQGTVKTTGHPVWLDFYLKSCP